MCCPFLLHRFNGGYRCCSLSSCRVCYYCRCCCRTARRPARTNWFHHCLKLWLADGCCCSHNNFLRRFSVLRYIFGLFFKLQEKVASTSLYAKEIQECSFTILAHLAYLLAELLVIKKSMLRLYDHTTVHAQTDLVG